MRLDGAKESVAGVRNKGLEATIQSCVRHWNWQPGDYLMLLYPSGRSTRYRIERIERPGGMQFTDCIFAPRDSNDVSRWVDTL